MKKYLVLLFLLLSEFAFSQIRLKQLEPCYDNLGNKNDSCFIMTNANGIPYYIGLDDLISIIGDAAVNCDSIGECLLNTNILCTALGNFPIGLPNSNDYIIARNGSSCKRILLDSIVGGSQLCDALEFTIDDITGDDYFLIKKEDGSCVRALISDLPGYGFDCDSVLQCLEDGALCDALRSYSSAVPAVSDSFIFIKNGSCRKGLLSSLIADIPCDSVLACLNDGVLCDALRTFTSGTPASGDSIWFVQDGECKKGLIDDLLGGGGSFNCDSVQACIADGWFCDSVTACLTEGALCEALTQFDIDGAGTGYYLYGDDDNGNCVRIPFDSVNQACMMEIEIGDFGANPEGCTFATTCDGGDTHTNQHWVKPVIDACDLQLWGASEGQADCLMSSVGLPQPTVTNQSACSGGGVNLKFNFSYCGVTTQVNLGTLTLGVTPGTNTFQLLLDGVSCDNAIGCACNPMIAPEPIEMKSNEISNIQQVDMKKLKRYKSFVEADKDKSLPSGGLYLVGKSRSIQVKL